MAIEQLFKSTIPSMQFIFSDGKVAHFVLGRYHTGKEKHIEELQAEINAGIGVIYVDSGEKEVDTDQLDPLAVLERKMRLQFMKEMAAAADPTGKVSVSEIFNKATMLNSVNQNNGEVGFFAVQSQEKEVSAESDETVVTAATESNAVVQSAIEKLKATTSQNNS